MFLKAHVSELDRAKSELKKTCDETDAKGPPSRSDRRMLASVVGDRWSSNHVSLMRTQQSNCIPSVRGTHVTRALISWQYVIC